MFLGQDKYLGGEEKGKMEERFLASRLFVSTSFLIVGVCVCVSNLSLRRHKRKRFLFFNILPYMTGLL